MNPVEGAGQLVSRDEKALSSDYVAASDASQRVLVPLWQQFLGVEPIGVDDDFFELGGHSLLAAELLVAVETAVGVRVAARTLYLEPTIAEMAEAIDRLRQEEAR